MELELELLGRGKVYKRGMAGAVRVDFERSLDLEFGRAITLTGALSGGGGGRQCMGMGDIWNMGSMSGDTAGREGGVEGLARWMYWHGWGERDLDLVGLRHRR